MKKKKVNFKKKIKIIRIKKIQLLLKWFDNNVLGAEISCRLSRRLLDWRQWSFIRIFLQKTPIQGNVNAANGTSIPMFCKVKMNVEAIPKQSKSSKRVLTIKVGKEMLHKLFSFTTALLHDWKMYGTRKENDDIEIKLTHEHFVFDGVLRFNDAILLAAKTKILPRN